VAGHRLERKVRLEDLLRGGLKHASGASYRHRAFGLGKAFRILIGAAGQESNYLMLHETVIDADRNR
jgi:hypothetical protein